MVTEQETKREAQEFQNAGRHRLQFEFSPDAYKRLKIMRDQAKAASFAELVRSSLRLYEWFLTKHKEGYNIALVRGNEPVREVELLF